MAASSKLLSRTLSSSLLRSCRLTSTSLLPTASRGHPGPFLSLHFCSAAPAAVDVATDPAVASVSSGHPWPEWVEFLDKLRAKGYFKQGVPASGVSAGEGAAGGGEAAAADNAAVAAADSAMASEDSYPFREQNRVKNACLIFARERYDLLSSLPKQDIQAIVECGCPNTNRKPVNAAKKLREFLQVEEKDACRVCKFRESCDRAYLVPKAEEAVRTVNVVRILLEYAMDTNNLSGENSVSASMQESARKLLSKLIVLSDTTIDPSVPKPVFQTSSKQQSSTKLSDKSKGARGSDRKGRETTAAEMKMGDWLCTKCHFMNFSRNKICFKCEEPRPKRQLNPGEWECPSCSYLNFRRNRICKKCSQDRPEDDTQDNQLALRNTRGAGKSRSFDFSDQDSDSDGDASPYKGFCKHVAGMRPKPDQRTSATRRGVVDRDDGLRTAKPRNPDGLRTAKPRSF
ncbi:zinc finger protein VAR3, chloroplastic [Panicum miliaceum]|uniref:Zinc finger protein VAR3, chloroplastic n=1 Tax=Panicum miliaceum TaxID=4540 RepID=A0A3L6TQ06_PANMI|nr:zinc finger protein VAR3, chloroplastic [Panicum miliaceum]